MMIREATQADVPAIARIHVASWQTTYAGIMPDDFLANLSVERRAEMWQRAINTHYVYVAEDENGEIIGFTDGGAPQEPMEGFDCQLYSIYLLADAQGKGAGRKLAETLMKRLYAEGYRSMMLWVLEDNPTARRFYEQLGGEAQVTDKMFTLGDTHLREVAYVWRDLSRFAE